MANEKKPDPAESKAEEKQASRVVAAVKKALKWTPALVHRKKNVTHYEGDSEFSEVGPRPQPVDIVQQGHTPRSIPRSRTAKPVPPKDIKG